MAYTAIPNFAAGDKWAYTDHNTYIVDNFIACPPDVFTAKGDLYLGTGNNTGVILAVGTNDHLLACDSGETSGALYAQFASRDIFAKYGVNTQEAILDSGATIINFDSQDYDSGSDVTTGAAWRFTVPAGMGGYYNVQFSVYLEADTDFDSGAIVEIVLYVGAVPTQILAGEQFTAASTEIHLSGGTTISLSAANEINLRVQMNSVGDDATIPSGTALSWVSIARMF